MKQLKKLTRIQKIRLNQFLKANNYRKSKPEDYGLVSVNKEGFTVALREENGENSGITLDIPW